MEEEKNRSYVLSRCQEDIQETDHAGITQMCSVVHLYCSACPMLGDRVIDEDAYKKMFKKYL